MKRLEKQLEVIEGEKSALTKSLKETQDYVEKGKTQLSIIQAGIVKVGSQIDALDSLKTETGGRVAEIPEAEPQVRTSSSLKLHMDWQLIKLLYFQLPVYQSWFNVSGREIDSLKKTLTVLENDYKSPSPVFDAIATLKGEVTTLREKVQPHSESDQIKV